MRKFTKRTATVAVAAVAVSGVGIAFAAWTSTGSGSATSGTDAAQAVSVTAAADAADMLFPGNTVDLVGTIDNSDNPYPVSVVLSESETVDITSNDAACDASHGVTADINSGAHAVGAATTATDVLIGTLHMSNDSINACFGKTFTVSLVTEATSAATS